MPASRRSIVLVAVAVALLAGLAAAPAPRLIFRRSPTVADRLPGDVRRVAMVVEPSGVLHAAFEVWTDSDWDVEYWTSIPRRTPKAVVLTNDLVEQRDVTLALNGDWMAIAWIDADTKAGTFALRVATKKASHFSWGKPVTIASGASSLAEPGLAVASDGRPFVVFLEGGRLRLASLAGSPARPVRATLPDVRAARHPQTAIGPDGGAIVYEADGGVWWMDRRRGRALGPTRVATAGRAPAVAAGRDGFTLAWAAHEELGTLNVTDVPQTTAVRAIRAPGLGDARPSIAFQGSTPVAAWAAAGSVRRLGSDGAVTTQAQARACCPALAGAADRTWTAWLESRAGRGIFRRARLAYLGPAGPFTVADRIPALGLPSG